MSKSKHALIGTVTMLCLLLGVQSAAATDPDRYTAAPASTTTPTSTATTASTEAGVKYGWGSVVSGDEFNYTGAPAATKWTVYDGAGHGGHGYRRPSAWYVNGWMATVTGNTSGTTGGMSARFGRQKYGRWETRMRTNARDPKYHPALLLWPDAATPSTCPEVDYAEGTQDTTIVKFFLHYGRAPSQTTAHRSVDTTQWHNYAVEWTSSHITGYIDGVQFFSDTNTAHLPPGSMHQTIQLDWFPDGTPTKTSTMSVAWVRVYRVG